MMSAILGTSSGGALPFAGMANPSAAAMARDLSAPKPRPRLSELKLKARLEELGVASKVETIELPIPVRERATYFAG